MRRRATEQITEELRGALSRLDDLGAQLDRAIDHAGRVEARTREVGFLGISRGMGDVGGRLRNIREQASTLAAAVRTAATSIAVTSDVRNPGKRR